MTEATVPPTGRVFAHRRDLIIVLGFLVVGGLVAWFRLPRAVEGTVWAEDGHVFLQAAISENPFAALFQVYEGYLQFVPRLLADFSILFGVTLAGPVINLASCFVVGFIAAIIYICSADVLPSRWMRAAAAAVTILAPLLPHEVLGNAANIHWFFLWLAPWLLLYRPRTWLQSWLLGALAVAAALTEIQLIVFLPLALLYWRDRKAWPVRIGLIVGVIAQIVVAVAFPRDRPNAATPPTLSTIVVNFFTQAVMPVYTTHAGVISRIGESRSLEWLLVIAFIPVAAGLFVTIRRGSRLQRIAGIALVAGAIVIWSAGVYLNHWIAVPFAFVRYGIVPELFLLGSVVVAAQVLVGLERPAWRRLGVVVVSVTTVLMLVSFFPSIPDRRGSGPSWLAAVHQAQQACSTGSVSHAVIETAPVIPQHSWVVIVPCSRLEK